MPPVIKNGLQYLIPILEKWILNEKTHQKFFNKILDNVKCLIIDSNGKKAEKSKCSTIKAGQSIENNNDPSTSSSAPTKKKRRLG
uniref:Uncharacterized protein n=1 Tax=Panagrolaimus davidi TaxID=227884 RepID=A0A914PR64_9BILA